MKQATAAKKKQAKLELWSCHVAPREAATGTPNSTSYLNANARPNSVIVQCGAKFQLKKGDCHLSKEVTIHMAKREVATVTFHSFYIQGRLDKQRNTNESQRNKRYGTGCW